MTVLKLRSGVRKPAGLKKQLRMQMSFRAPEIIFAHALGGRLWNPTRFNVL